MKRKIGVLGSGAMAENLIEGWVKTLDPKSIFTSDIDFKKSELLDKKYGVHSVKDSEELLEKSDVLVLAVKPQNFYEAIESLKGMFQKDHIILSIVAGIGIFEIQKLIPETPHIIRVMPNIATSISQSIIGIQLPQENLVLEKITRYFFEPLGKVVFIENEEKFKIFTVACGSGIGFIYEIMQYWQEWLEENQFEKNQSQEIVKTLFLGTSLLAEKKEVPFLELQKRVTSKNGVTESGLRFMRENNLESVLRGAFERALERDTELSK